MGEDVWGVWFNVWLGGLHKHKQACSPCVHRHDVLLLALSARVVWVIYVKNRVRDSAEAAQPERRGVRQDERRKEEGSHVYAYVFLWLLW